VGDNFITGSFIIFTPQKIFKWWFRREWCASVMWYECKTREI